MVSGTLSYAMGAGRAVVSTPFAAASELLADGRGVLVPPGSPARLASALNRLLAAPAERAELGRLAYEHSRTMVWSAVGAEYGRLFARLAGSLIRAHPSCWRPSVPERAGPPRVSSIGVRRPSSPARSAAVWFHAGADLRWPG
jgi:hypothetical protein